MAITVTRPEEDVLFCPDGSLHAKFQAAEEELTALQRKGLNDDRLNDPKHVKAREVIALEERVKAESLTFRVRGMRKQDWRDLVAKHKVNKDSEIDKVYGFAFHEVTAEAIPQCIVAVTKDGESVVFDPATEWVGLAEEMTDAQYEAFQIAAVKVNRGRQQVPFSQAAYRMTRPSEKK